MTTYFIDRQGRVTGSTRVRGSQGESRPTRGSGAEGGQVPEGVLIQRRRKEEREREIAAGFEPGELTPKEFEELHGRKVGVRPEPIRRKVKKFRVESPEEHRKRVGGDVFTPAIGERLVREKEFGKQSIDTTIKPLPEKKPVSKVSHLTPVQKEEFGLVEPKPKRGAFMGRLLTERKKVGAGGLFPVSEEKQEKVRAVTGTPAFRAGVVAVSATALALGTGGFALPASLAFGGGTAVQYMGVEHLSQYATDIYTGKKEGKPKEAAVEIGTGVLAAMPLFSTTSKLKTVVVGGAILAGKGRVIGQQVPESVLQTKEALATKETQELISGIDIGEVRAFGRAAEKKAITSRPEAKAQITQDLQNRKGLSEKEAKSEAEKILTSTEARKSYVKELGGGVIAEGLREKEIKEVGDKDWYKIAKRFFFEVPGARYLVGNEAGFKTEVQQQLRERGLKGEDLEKATQFIMEERALVIPTEVATVLVAPEAGAELAGGSILGSLFRAGAKVTGKKLAIDVGTKSGASTLAAAQFEIMAALQGQATLERRDVTKTEYLFGYGLGLPLAGTLGFLQGAVVTKPIRSKLVTGVGYAIDFPGEIVGDITAFGARKAKVITTPSAIITEPTIEGGKYQLGVELPKAPKQKQVKKVRTPVDLFGQPIKARVPTFAPAGLPSTKATLPFSFFTDTKTPTDIPSKITEPAPIIDGTPINANNILDTVQDNFNSIVGTPTSTTVPTSAQTNVPISVPTVVPYGGGFPPLFPPLFPGMGGSGQAGRKGKRFINELAAAFTLLGSYQPPTRKELKKMEFKVPSGKTKIKQFTKRIWDLPLKV